MALYVQCWIPQILLCDFYRLYYNVIILCEKSVVPHGQAGYRPDYWMVYHQQTGKPTVWCAVGGVGAARSGKKILEYVRP